MNNRATVKTYVTIFGWLAFLTLLEIGAVMLNFERLALVIFIIGTALGKATLIALYFMHLKFENRLTWFLPIVPVLFGIIFMATLFPDLVFHLSWRT